MSCGWGMSCEAFQTDPAELKAQLSPEGEAAPGSKALGKPSVCFPGFKSGLGAVLEICSILLLQKQKSALQKKDWVGLLSFSVSI